ncbi:LysR family transcriptional regulator [Amycolatopsis rubida]|uniref:LysR family transcriptional regulator n=1 Tax=Amycolatopsis rubida TaxID=112413 RepID=A0ABX0CBX2_9PSEU|nr:MULTISPECIES: LysR family transcriptional regulator [Amycolatopsis]MYW97440.1 LysR family transcriptional regulator [Amycolatopsis rubida]NEC62425.1 LysR family transcriptional regulator [Amycolatopsis rubida]OAP21586.1 HTH-type transcriptional regulator CynR [Amycolatopsis sp. M39]
MTLNQLMAFACAVRLRSFTAAAKELGLTQPGVSDLIQRLESELGEVLFVRHRRALKLTAAGQELYPYAKHAIEAAHNGAAAVRSLKTLEGGSAAFGLLRNSPYYIGSDLAATFHRTYPNVRLRLVGQNSSETGEDVRNLDLEAGLVTLPIDEDDLGILQVARDEVFYASSDSADAGEPMAIADFCRRPLVLYDAHYRDLDPARRQLAHRAAVAGLAVEPHIEVEYLTDALDLVAEGFGGTVVCGAALRSQVESRGLTVRPFAEPLYDTLALIKRPDQPLSSATREIALLAVRTLLGHAAALPTVSLLPGADETAIRNFLGVNESVEVA